VLGGFALLGEICHTGADLWCSVQGCGYGTPQTVKMQEFQGMFIACAIISGFMVITV